MLNDYQNRLNQDLARKARLALLIRSFKDKTVDESLQQKFDENGEVIRNYRRELAIIAEDETKFWLGSVDTSMFTGYEPMVKYLESHKKEDLHIDTVKLAPITVNYNMPLLTRTVSEKGEVRYNIKKPSTPISMLKTLVSFFW